MNKRELTDALTYRTGQTKAAAGKQLDVLLDLLGRALAEGASIRLSGFGSFQVCMRAARTGRHPSTGEPIKIPASFGVKFAAGKSLTERINRASAKDGQK